MNIQVFSGNSSTNLPLKDTEEFLGGKIDAIEITGAFRHLPDGRFVCNVVTINENGAITVKEEDWSRHRIGQSGCELWPCNTKTLFRQEITNVPS